MRRRPEDFATWLAARWPVLVRTLVLWGHREAEAEQAAREALARVLPSWARERREGDVDVLAFRALLEEHQRRRRAQEADTDAAVDDRAPAAQPVPGLADRLERRRELEAHLATLDDDARVRAVLHHVAGLDLDDVDDVAGPGPAPAPLPLSAPDVRDACDAVPVPPASPADVEARVRHRRRRTATRVAAVVAVVAVVLGATTWWTSGQDGDREGQVSAARNPFPFPWWADGTLHLARVEVAAAGLERLLTVPDGVVWSDDEGAVFHVDGTGETERIGTTVPGTRLAVEPDNGWVAWADPGDGSPELVVHDTFTGREVGRRPLTSGGGQPLGDHGPIAVTGERVLYSSPDGDFAWEPVLDLSFALSGSLVDSAGDSRVTRSDGVLRVSPLTYQTGTVVDASDARLTPDGRYAFGLQDEHAFEKLKVFDVASGRTIPLYSPSDEARAWTYADGTFYFAVVHMLQDKAYQDLLQMPSEGDYRIYACRPEAPDPCQRIGVLPESLPTPPVFPG